MVKEKLTVRTKAENNVTQAILSRCSNFRFSSLQILLPAAFYGHSEGVQKALQSHF